MYNWKVVLITISLLIGLRIADPKLVEQFRLNYFDSLQYLQTPVDSGIVLVDIDETSLEKLESSLEQTKIENENLVEQIQEQKKITDEYGSKS